VLEDRQLEAMMIEEESASVYQTASTDLDLVRQQFAEQHHELNDEKEKLQKDVVRFEGERKAAVSSIPATDMGLYNKIRRQRRGIAVAKVTDKACSACGTILSAALLHAARSPNEINICDTCSRILYVG
jgi:predicted  nucleic acid-binding Zn-ribbon protein